MIVRVLLIGTLDPEEIIKSENFEVLTYGQLMKHFNIKKIKYLKIDTKGHDLVILRSMIKYYSMNLDELPHKITFESNILSDRTQVFQMILTLINMGYTMKTLFRDTVMILSSN